MARARFRTVVMTATVSVRVLAWVLARLRRQGAGWVVVAVFPAAPAPVGEPVAEVVGWGGRRKGQADGLPSLA